MRYFRKLRTKTAVRDPLMQAEDPMSGVANLFDCSVVFIVALILALFSVYHLQDLFSEKSSFSMIKHNEKNQEMEIITKKGKTIKAVKLTKESVQGRGERLGIAYKLEDGTMVYVPE